MALQEDKKDRSYQYGRLLAIFEKIERDTYEKVDERETNATRLQTAYKEQPLRYSSILQSAINPYLEKLKPRSRAWYRKMIQDIIDIISDFPDEELNRPLGETYLLGYYLQRKELYTKKDKED